MHMEVILVNTQLLSRLGLALASLSLAVTALELPALAEAPGTTQTQIASTKMAKSNTIVDVAVSNPNFSTLVAAVKAAGLVEVLSGKGPFTVFAPTNEAFAALPAGTVESLLKPENRDKLRKILTYHVVSGEVLSTSLKSGKVKTVEGSPVTVTVADGKVMVNNATVVGADVKASNGVIHVINQVILPPNL